MSLYRYQLRQRIATMVDDGFDLFTAASPSSGTFVDTTKQKPNDYYNDDEGYIYDGNVSSIGKTFTITDFANSGTTFTFKPASTLVANDLGELHKRASVTTYNRLINEAIDSLANWALADKIDESIVLNSILTDGLLEVWTSTSVLTNWTASGTGTLTQESSVKLEGLYSAKMTNTAANAYILSQSITNFPKYTGATATLKARISCNTADRVRIRLTDGVNTWNSDYHDGKGWREEEDTPELKIEDVTISDNATELTVSIRIESGSQITCYVDKMYLEVGDYIYEYTVPSGFLYLSAIYEEESPIDVFNDFPINQYYYEIVQGTTPKLRFRSNIWTPWSGKRLRLVGQQNRQASLTADTGTIDEDLATYICYKTAALLLQSIDETKGKTYEALAVAEKQRLHTRLHQGARRIRNN